MNIQVYDCPSTSIKWTGNWPSHFRFDYGYNEHIANASLAELIRPAETLTLADATANPDYGTHGGYSWRIRDAYRGPDISTGYIHPRHNEGANLGFADGHAKWARVSHWETMSAGQAWNIPGVRFHP